MANKKILAALIATITASLCCITPVLAVLAGAGSFASTFSWLEPYHNYLVVLTILILAFAWWDKLKAKKDALDCACDEKTKFAFFSTKKFLAIVTLLAIFMLSFPLWGHKYFEVEGACNTCVTVVKKPVNTTNIQVAKQSADAKAQDTASLVQTYIDAEKENPTTNFDGQTCSGIGYEEADNLLSFAKEDIVEMAPAVLHKMLENEENVILLDVREKEQRSEGEIYADETYAMTRGNLEFRIMNTIKDKNAIIVAYCRSGGRSVFAAQTMKKLGYKNTYSLRGGLKEWALSGFAFENGLGVVVKVKGE